MHQLIFNLVVNGVQHGTGAVGVEAVGDDEQITITVASTGQPIPAGALPTLFDPLTRSRYRNPGGLRPAWVGMYIGRCIAYAHNGTIEVESGTNGTVFTVKMPRVVTL